MILSKNYQRKWNYWCIHPIHFQRLFKSKNESSLKYKKLIDIGRGEVKLTIEQFKAPRWYRLLSYQRQLELWNSESGRLFNCRGIGSIGTYFEKVNIDGGI